MAQHSPLAFHYNPKKNYVMLDKQTPIIIKACDTLADATPIEAAELDKLLALGAPGYVLHLIRYTSVKAWVQQEVPHM